jgi:protein AATF/BFR2
MNKFDLDNTAPDWDSNDEGSNSEQEEEEHDATEHYVSVEKSSLRNHLELVMDPKYNGEKVSRKDLFETQVNKELEFDSDDDSEIVSIQADDSTDEEEAYENSGNDDDNDEIEELVVKEDEKKLVKKMNLASSTEAEKGQHVRSQMSLWDGFLDLRIRTQKILDTANSMPQGETYNKITEDDETKDAIDQASAELLEMFDYLVAFQKV